MPLVVGFVGASTAEAHATDPQPIREGFEAAIAPPDQVPMHCWMGTVTDDPTCPVCGDAVSGVATRGPAEHFAQPCGHRVPAQFLEDDE